MDQYLEDNADYWEKGYTAPNVPQSAFLFYGRILDPDFGISGDDGEAVLDYGCGQGATVDFFNRNGFDAYGVDISTTDLNVAKARYPGIENRFAEIEPEPATDDSFFDQQFDVIVALRSLYYYSDTDLQTRLSSLYESLKPGGVFFATMMGAENEQFYDNSTEHRDGLREVNFSNSRYSVENYYVNFTEGEDDLREKFSMFDEQHVGFTSERYRSDEGTRYHYTFAGTKS